MRKKQRRELISVFVHYCVLFCVFLGLNGLQFTLKHIKMLRQVCDMHVCLIESTDLGNLEPALKWGLFSMANPKRSIVIFAGKVLLYDIVM